MNGELKTLASMELTRREEILKGAYYFGDRSRDEIMVMIDIDRGWKLFEGFVCRATKRIGLQIRRGLKRKEKDATNEI